MRELTKSDFDGHLEKPLSEMTPKEKLVYLSAQIQLKRYIDKHAKKVRRGKEG